MSQTHYTQLSLEQRAQIEGFLKINFSQAEIARAIGCSQSTISREKSRNSTPNLNKTTRVNETVFLYVDSRNFRGSKFVDVIRTKKESYYTRLFSFKRNQPHYTAKKAQEFRDERSSFTSHKKCLPKLERPENAYLLEIVKKYLKLRWSPEQISLRIDLINLFLILLGSPPLMPKISHRIIYKYIKEHPEEELEKYLRRRGKRYRYQSAKTFNQTNREKHSIHDRPQEIDDNTKTGHKEGDTIVGLDKKDRIITHVDRLTGVAAIGLVKGFNANNVSKATIYDLKRVFGNNIKSITYDNGVEFSAWQDTEKQLRADIYFADPYRSCQRGRNENFNGLVRDFFPKKTDFKTLTKSDIIKVESLLNNRPRKRFGGLTPLEVQELLMLCT